MARAKGIARRVADRVARPYVDDVVRRVAKDARAQARRPKRKPVAGVAENPTPSSAPSDNFHHALHELRTLALAKVPKGARRALSVGANGAWYFDWFETCVGPVEEHIGIEAFEAKPDDLQPYVTWIPETADKMESVGDGYVDVVFAGQTTEHLWADELADFLAEAHRVLSPGGVLVLDSPNRLVTEHLHWSHGGHTVELSLEEIEELLVLASFEVESSRGLWRCRFGDDVLQLEERADDAAGLVRRAVTDPEAIDDDFVWWVNSRRLDQPIDREKLRRRTHELFDQHFPTRISRGLYVSPDDTEVRIPEGRGFDVSTMEFPLEAGTWRLTVKLSDGQFEDLAGFRVELVGYGFPGLAFTPETAVESAPTELSWDFDISEMTFTLNLNFHVDAAAVPAALALPVGLRLRD